MTNSTRIRIAAVATALFIAALSVTGLAVRGTHQPQAPAAVAAVTPQPGQRTAAAPSADSAVDATADIDGEDSDSWESDDD